ncbi:MAG: hypothetical protein ACO3NZ_08415 [Pirellulales bacterium]|jgi:hypothetical protein
MSHSSASTSAANPSSQLRAIARLLSSVRRRAGWWVCVEAVALLGLTLAAAFWGSLAVDRLLEPPAWVRAAMVLASVAGLAWILRHKLVDRLGIRLSNRSLALLVERHHPFLHESLVTTVELGLDQQQGTPRPDPIDPELLARTTAEAVAGLPQVRVADLFQRRELGTLLFSGLMAGATIAACVLISPETASLWLRRVVLLDETPWPRRSRLIATDFRDGVRVVARGSDVDVVVAADTSMVVPEVLDMRWQLSGASRSARMGRRGAVIEGQQLFGHVIESITEDIVFSVRGGDARLDGLRLEVVDPPALSSLTIDYKLPDYLGGGQRRVPASGIVQVPQGSTVNIVCRSTKPLLAAGISETVAGEPVSLAAFESAAAGSSDGGGANSPTDTIEATLSNLSGEHAISVSLVDTDGIANTQPIGFLLSARPDEAPQVAMQLHGISTAVTVAARVPLVGRVSDDHALAAVDVELERERTDASPRVEVLRVPRCRGGEPLVEFATDAAEIVDLSLIEPLTGDTVRVRVTARDNAAVAGGPHVTTGDAWTLAVVTPAELAAMLEARELLLRRRYESLLANLTEARDSFESSEQPLAARLGQAAARAGGETGEIAEAFALIHLEFDNNGLLTAELDTRLLSQIARPLASLAEEDLPGLVAQTRTPLAADDIAGRRQLVAQTDVVIGRMRAVLDRMLELETFNEVVDLLRSTISAQEEIRQETRDIQKERARALLEDL